MSASVTEPSLPGALDRFLAEALPGQTANVARHALPDGRMAWVKKAGPRHGRWRYWLLGAIAGLLRMDVLRPVPNLGGNKAIALEASRLRELGELGLRVPAVLAQRADGLLLDDLGQSGAPAITLDEELVQAARSARPADPPVATAPLLTSWSDGLQAIARVHATGSYLSQAFARNLVRCPDGVIGYIDFEDNPRAALPLALCQARDWLSYLHSTTLTLREGGALDAAGAIWSRALAGADAAVQLEIRHSAQRMAWMQRLPADRRWGRDLQRLQAAAQLLARAALATSPARAPD